MNTEAGPHAWLDAAAVRIASDIVLGGILLVAGTGAVWDAGGVPLRHWSPPDARYFPAAVGVLLWIIGAVLLVRGTILAPPRAARPTPRDLAIVVAGIAVFVLAVWRWGRELALQFGPPELAAVVALELAVAIALARASRARAAGMALLGLLLAAVGMDPSTGTLRLTMGIEALFTGIDVAVILLGLFVVADAAVCLVSPSLFLASYARQVRGWRAPAVAVPAALSMRVAAVLAVVAACFYAHALHASAVDLVWLAIFGVFGVGCRIFGWNRLVLCLAAAGGEALEANIGHTMLVLNGDPSVFLRWPVSAALLLLAAAVLAVGAALSVRRVRTAAASRPVNPER